MKLFSISFLVVFCCCLLVVDPTKGDEALDLVISSGEKPDEVTTLTPDEILEENTTVAVENEEVVSESPADSSEACEEVGTSADENDCRSFYSCSANPEDGSLKLSKHQCPDNQAFSENFKTCTRDISSCNVGPECLSKGKFPDPSSGTSYYWCVENNAKDGFRKFHVQCGSNEVFVAAYSQCIWDISLPYIPSVGVSDEQIVKLDNKLMTNIEKERVKDEKRKKKEEAKLIKEEEKRKKKAAKEAEKAAEKARKEQEKQNKGNKEDKVEGCSEI